MTAGTNEDDEDVEIVKWYTRARRFPQLIGKTADGTRIWGGPYTLTQVVVGVSMLIVGGKTAWLWGQFGLIGNAMVLLSLTYGAILALGRLPIGARNPLSILGGTVRALTAPSQGRIAGVPARATKAQLYRSRLLISSPAARQPFSDPPAPAPSSFATWAPRWRGDLPSKPVIGTINKPITKSVTGSRPAPAPTGVQLLLAGGPSRAAAKAAAPEPDSTPSTVSGPRAARREI